MDRVYEANAVASPPAAPGTPSTGYPTDGNPSSGIPATKPGEYWFYMMNESLRRVLVAAGITPDHTDLDQVKNAIQTIAGAPAGTVSYWPDDQPPANALVRDGSAVSRSTYAALFAALTFTDATVDTTNASTTVSMGDTSRIEAGYGIEGSGIPSGTTVASVDDGTTLTLSQAATATASDITARFYRFGMGDGSTTFNVPDDRGEFVRGWDIGRGVDSGRTLGSWQADEFESHDHGGGVHDHTAYRADGGGGLDAVESGSSGGSTTNEAIHDSGAIITAQGGAETRPRNRAYLPIIYF